MEDQEWAYKTVKTLLSRLVAKEAIEYDQIGNSYLYRAAVDRDVATRREVRGVIRFDRPVVAVLCVYDHLRAMDELVGLGTVQYPQGQRPNRGLEPSSSSIENRERYPDWAPDELTLSQDRTTVAIRAFANTERGMDQVRILTLSK